MEKILVTGAAGFLGAHVAEYLAELGHAVVGIDDLSGGFLDNLSETVDFRKMSVNDSPAINDLFRYEKFGRVLHFAAYAAEGLSHNIRRFNYENNLVGSVNLINASINHGVERFVFASSVAVYGAQEPPMSEDVTPRPEDPYGVAKFAVEQDLRIASEVFGLEYAIVRPHNIYGPKQHTGDHFRNVVGIFLRQIAHGLPLTIFGNGQQTRSFTFVADLLEPIAQLATTEKGRNVVLNIGSDEVSTVSDLAKKLLSITGSGVDLHFLPERHEVEHAVPDHSKSIQFLGPYAATSLDDGLAQTVQWFNKAGIRSPSRFGQIEVRKGLPSSWEQYFPQATL